MIWTRVNTSVYQPRANKNDRQSSRVHVWRHLLENDL
jgi:hypothetical protein